MNMGYETGSPQEVEARRWLAGVRQQAVEQTLRKGLREFYADQPAKLEQAVQALEKEWKSGVDPGKEMDMTVKAATERAQSVLKAFFERQQPGTPAVVAREIPNPVVSVENPVASVDVAEPMMDEADTEAIAQQYSEAARVMVEQKLASGSKPEDMRKNLDALADKLANIVMRIERIRQSSGGNLTPTMEAEFERVLGQQMLVSAQAAELDRRFPPPAEPRPEPKPQGAQAPEARPGEWSGTRRELIDVVDVPDLSANAPQERQKTDTSADAASAVDTRLGKGKSLQEVRQDLERVRDTLAKQPSKTFDAQRREVASQLNEVYRRLRETAPPAPAQERPKPITVASAEAGSRGSTETVTPIESDRVAEIDEARIMADLTDKAQKIVEQKLKIMSKEDLSEMLTTQIEDMQELIADMESETEHRQDAVIKGKKNDLAILEAQLKVVEASK